VGTPVSSISIVTPCLNAESLIGRTAESIMAQTAVRSGRVKLQYLVCDGNSRDGTLDVVRRVCGGAAAIISDRDSGMYDALAQGLRLATGDVVAYLNAGDLYCPTALDVVADVFEQNDVDWITGLQVEFNEKGQVISAYLPCRFRRRLIQAGMYGGRILPRFIQQESTFWRRGLQRHVDFEHLAGLQLAGDYYLWTCFARQSELTLVQSYLGGFSYQEGQKSEALDAYRREVASFTVRPRLRDLVRALVDAVAWPLPLVRGEVHHRGMLRYSLGEHRWKDAGARWRARP
jgi:glycosyltransferase involved in cell wall biosynthesis